MINRLTIVSATACVLFAWSATFAQSSGTQLMQDSRAGDAGARAMAALGRLDREVIVYRSLADFEAGQKLSLAPLATFEHHLMEVSNEVMPLLDQVPAGKFKNDLSNALDSYRDGLFWWKKIADSRVIDVRSLRYATSDPTAADAALRATIPYTVAIHWRQAHKYLRQAEQSIGRP